jgi:hypothetical protein
VVLDLVDCPDRRLAKAAAEMVQAEAQLPGVGVTAVLPRRSYTPLLGRLLHDRTADRIASVVSQIPHAAATIVPFDVRRRVETMAARQHAKAAAEREARAAAERAGRAPAEPEGGTAVPASGDGARAQAAEEERTEQEPAGAAPGGAEARPAGTGDDDAARQPEVDLTADAEGPKRGPDSTEREPALGEPPAPEPPAPSEATDISRYNRPVPSKAATPIGRLPRRGKARVEGRVHTVEIRPVERNTVLACEIADATGQLTALFYGRSHIPGLDPGAKVRFTGQVGMRGNVAVMINPAYELLAPGEDASPPL